jgi:hypothetical protein
MSQRTSTNASGFVLLEALVAMSLVAGLGITAFEVYQSLLLRYGKNQELRRQLHLEADQHEIQTLEKEGVGELARMPRGNGALSHTHRPITKGQQRNAHKAGST